MIPYHLDDLNEAHGIFQESAHSKQGHPLYQHDAGCDVWISSVYPLDGRSNTHQHFPHDPVIYSVYNLRCAFHTESYDQPLHSRALLLSAQMPLHVQLSQLSFPPRLVPLPLHTSQQDSAKASAHQRAQELPDHHRLHRK